MSAKFVTVQFRMYPDLNTKRAKRELECLGMDPKTITNVSKGRPVTFRLIWNEINSKRLSSLGRFVRA